MMPEKKAYTISIKMNPEAKLRIEISPSMSLNLFSLAIVGKVNLGVITTCLDCTPVTSLVNRSSWRPEPDPSADDSESSE